MKIVSVKSFCPRKIIKRNMSWTATEQITATQMQKIETPIVTYTPLRYNMTEHILHFRTTLAQNGETQKNFQNQVILWALIDGFLFFAIVSGNVLTISAIFMNRRISRMVSNQFILSLACSDLLVGLMMPYHMMFYIEPALGEHFALCITRLALVSLACTASVMNIIGIAIDRFLAIVYPLHYNKFMTKRLARCLVSVAWIVAISISITPIFWNQWEKNSNKGESKVKCEMGYVLVPLYVMTVYLPTFVLLFTIMCGFYIKIFSESRKHARRIMETNHFKNHPLDTTKSLQVLMLVMGSFTISYTPFLIIVIVNSILQYKTITMSIVYKVCNSLAMANSAVNPLIYAWKNKDFKTAFWKILHCKSLEGNCCNYLIRKLILRKHIKQSCFNRNSVTPDIFFKNNEKF